jgi:hypothetical protein
LFHTSFVPDLTQVNFFPAAVAVIPAFVHLAPALTAANEGGVKNDRHSNTANTMRERVISQRYQSFILN